MNSTKTSSEYPRPRFVATCATAARRSSAKGWSPFCISRPADHVLCPDYVQQSERAFCESGESGDGNGHGSAVNRVALGVPRDTLPKSPVQGPDASYRVRYDEHHFRHIRLRPSQQDRRRHTEPEGSTPRHAVVRDPGKPRLRIQRVPQLHGRVASISGKRRMAHNHEEQVICIWLMPRTTFHPTLLDWLRNS